MCLANLCCQTGNRLLVRPLFQSQLHCFLSSKDKLPYKLRFMQLIGNNEIHKDKRKPTKTQCSCFEWCQFYVFYHYPQGARKQVLSSECKTKQADFADWMSFLSTNLMKEINSIPKDKNARLISRYRAKRESRRKQKKNIQEN